MDHGIQIENVYFQAWFVAVPLLFVALSQTFKALNLWNFPCRRGTRASEIMAFMIVAGLCVTWLGIAGVIGFYGLFGVDCEGDFKRTAVEGTDPYFYGRSDFVENHMIYPMISYQGWNLLYTLINPDQFSFSMVGHHGVTGLLAYFGLRPYLQYYGLFFFGIAELTNIPLTFVDTFK